MHTRPPWLSKLRTFLAALVVSRFSSARAWTSSHATRSFAFSLARPAPSVVDPHHFVRSTPTPFVSGGIQSMAKGAPRACGVLRMSGAGSGTVMHQGLKELADKYDAFLVDQWGVMHDGTNAYAATTECMKELTGMGKKIVLLSNSSRRKENSLDKLDKMGFDSKAIIDLVTSGETAWKGFNAEQKYAPFDGDLEGSKCFVFGNGEEDAEYVAACGLEFAEIEEADFILARGLFTMHDSEEVLTRTGPDAFEMWDAEALRVLQIGAARLLPMLVTNPDFVRPDGNDSPMPGKLGAMYESVLANAMFGGRLVFYIGKPHRLVYDEAFRLLRDANGGEEVGKERVCAVGDSLLHDVEGALRYGIDAVLIADGVHAEALGMQQGKPGQVVESARLDALHDSLFTRPPTYTLPHFQWT